MVSDESWEAGQAFQLPWEDFQAIQADALIGPISIHMLEPIRIMTSSSFPPPKRFYRTFWRHLVRKLLKRVEGGRDSVDVSPHWVIRMQSCLSPNRVIQFPFLATPICANPPNSAVWQCQIRFSTISKSAVRQCLVKCSFRLLLLKVASFRAHINWRPWHILPIT